MGKICGGCIKYVPPEDGYCSADPERRLVDYGDRACKDYICKYNNPEQNSETSGWYCGEPANEKVPVGGNVWAEPSFSFCPHCGRPMKGEHERK